MNAAARRGAVVAGAADWIRSPLGWQIKPLKTLTRKIGSGKTPRGGAAVYTDTGVIFLRSQNVHDTGLILEDVVRIPEQVDEEMWSTRVEPGDVLLNITGASLGRSARVPVSFPKANVNQHVCIIRAHRREDGAWIALCLQSQLLKAQIDRLENGAGREGINFEQVGNLLIPFARATEQLTILRVVAEATAQIDALIEKKTRFIELLDEKRQALITRAATKGLDPKVRMKDSGVEWLGRVPEHWHVCALRWRATVQTGVALGKEAHDENSISLPYLRVANVQDGFLDLSEVKEVALSKAEVERHLLRPGDVLMNEGGDNDKLGRGAVWHGEISPCAHQNHVFAVRPSSSLSSEWLALFSQSDAAKFYLWQSSKQSTNLASISSNNLKALSVPIPPISEQRHILDVLSGQIESVDHLSSLVDESVELLRERRSTLITAAVTGQIDVGEGAIA
jgi:type I restriction enzyme S subunit